MKVSFERGEEIRREARSLPADLYNTLHVLIARTLPGALFIPIRSMQYLAVADREEIIFVDGQGPRIVEIAWREFRPQARAALHEPVPYQCVYYEHKGLEVDLRLQGEFLKALRQCEHKQLRSGAPGGITPLQRE